MALIAMALTPALLERSRHPRVIHLCSVRYLGIEVDDALGVSEQTKI